MNYQLIFGALTGGVVFILAAYFHSFKYGFPFIKLGHYSPDLDRLFLAFMARNANSVKIGQYYAEVDCGDIRLTFWCENRMYAIAKEGKVERISTGEVMYTWDNAHASRRVSDDMWRWCNFQVCAGTVDAIIAGMENK